MRTYFYLIDKEGRLWIEGSELNDPQVLKFFMKRLEKSPGGGFMVDCMGEKNLVQAEDVPYVVQSIHVGKNEIQLVFPGNYQETLDPSTLFVGQDNVLYCKVRSGEFTARFNRKPYLELTHLIEGGQGRGYFLHWQGEKYPISGVVDGAEPA
jgi:hypothetical protein